MKNEKKIVEVCQDCGIVQGVEKAYPTGYLCHDCLAIAVDDGDDDSNE